MTIRKRSLPKYIVLNCLTLGIYGFIVSKHIDREINALCKGDGEQPAFSYTGAVLFRAIPTAIGLLFGFIMGLIGADFLGGYLYYYFYVGYGLTTVIFVVASMLAYGFIFTAVGQIISGLYYNYWWYKQASRLKLNAYRYGLIVKESGTDHYLFRTVLEILFLPISAILIGLSCLVPLFLFWLLLLAGAYAFAFILLLVFAVVLMLFGRELTTGSNFAIYFVFKNLNRYADVYRNGAAPFDPMGYPYYPSVESRYPNFLPNMINGYAIAAAPAPEVVEDVQPEQPQAPKTGSLIGLKGSCAGYTFEFNPGEEIVIGKDAKVSQVLIETAYKEISRKHVGISYDVVRDEYRVVDYSSNGTWANGSKMVQGQPTFLPHGTELELANNKTRFRLG